MYISDMTIMARAEVFGQFNLVLIFGILLLAGAIASRIFQKLHIPQVVACVIIGILAGSSVLDFINAETIEALRPFTMFTLGIIGFMIGGELRADVFRKYGRQFFIILFAQGIGAFVFVAVGATAVMWFITHELNTSVAVGLVLGAIASATAPAATVNVLWEYKTRGALTTAILAIVALDDGLALLLYRAAATAADALLGNSNGSVLTTVIMLVGEIVSAILLGFLLGVLLYYLLKFVKADDKALTFTIAALLLVVGISLVPDIDPILPAMTLGVTIANLNPRRSKYLFGLVEKFTPPIYVLFFVLAGAHTQFRHITAWTLVMIAVYAICRASGKILGSRWGAKWSAAAAAVRNYLGICLLPQAGVAIGLAILSGQMFHGPIGQIVILTVMTSTFIMELSGPPLVRLGVKRAGEIGLNITEEDLIKTYTIKDVMSADLPPISAGTTLTEIIRIFTTTTEAYYPVVDNDRKLIGAVTIDGIKNTLSTPGVSDWLVALDIVEPVVATATAEDDLEDVIETMTHLVLDYIPVTAGPDDKKLLGVLDYHALRRRLAAEVLEKQQKADASHVVG